jgi:hypothetical protein
LLDTPYCNAASVLFRVAGQTPSSCFGGPAGGEPMDKVKPLTGVFAFIILSSFSTDAYTGDVTSFDFRNYTSTPYNITLRGKNYFETKINDEFGNPLASDRPFSELAQRALTLFQILPGKTKNFEVEGDCSTGKDSGAALTWDVHKLMDETIGARFSLDIPNDREGHCKARKFRVDDNTKPHIGLQYQYRKIELGPIPYIYPPSTTPIPYFRFTIREQGVSVIFEQEGPQAKPFN